MPRPASTDIAIAKNRLASILMDSTPRRRTVVPLPLPPPPRKRRSRTRVRRLRTVPRRWIRIDASWFNVDVEGEEEEKRDAERGEDRHT